MTQLHFPTISHLDFEGRTGKGDFADSLVEMDARVGQIIDAIEARGLRDDTLFIFASDNGPNTGGPGADPPACGPAPTIPRWKVRSGCR